MIDVQCQMGVYLALKLSPFSQSVQFEFICALICLKNVFVMWILHMICDIDGVTELDNFFFSPYGLTALYGPGPPHFVEVSWSHTLDTSQSVGRLWTRDQLVAETSTW
jgi:hypothetical protein